jgi:hypothetical protein
MGPFSKTQEIHDDQLEGASLPSQHKEVPSMGMKEKFIFLYFFFLSFFFFLQHWSLNSRPISCWVFSRQGLTNYLPGLDLN